MTNTVEQGIEHLRGAGQPVDAEWLIARFPATDGTRLSLTDESDLELTRQLANALLARRGDSAALDALEEALTSGERRASLVLQLAVKMARSKRLLRDRRAPLFLSVVFAVYKEHERILTPAQHPHGEDFLNRKLRQLEWLLGDIPDADYELIVVDDGCPEGSGRIVRELAATSGRAERVRVLFLADAIQDRHPATAGLASPNDSRKGGSVELGMWEAASADRGDGHVIVFTDADLSTHLGQCGLLIDAIAGDTPVAIGSRRHPRSVVIKGGARNDRGKLFIYLWKRMLAPLHAVTDTQCGFKAFDAGVVPRVLDGVIERQFAFDIELMLKAQLLASGADAIARVGVAWIDSEALSTTTDLQPYLSMLQTAAKLYRRHLEPTPQADAFAAFVEGLDEERWQALAASVPDAIRERDPREFGAWDGVSVEQLAGE